MNTMSLFSLVKPVLLFTFDRKRLAYLTVVPFCLLSALALLVARFPLLTLADTVEPEIDVNIYMLSFAVIFVGFVFLSLMLHTQRILFFGEGAMKGRFFCPMPDGCFWRYLFVCIRLAGVSLFLSALTSGAVILLLRYFGGFSDKQFFIFLGGTVMFCPYFMARFVMKLSAQAAERPLGWMRAWQMVGRLSIMTMAMMAMFFVVPMSVSAYLYMKMQELHLSALMLLCNGGMLYSFVLACILQSAFCGYMYSILSSQA